MNGEFKNKFQTFFWPNFRVTFRWIPLRRTPWIVCCTKLEIFESQVFDLKPHFQTGIWTERSENKFQMLPYVAFIEGINLKFFQWFIDCSVNKKMITKLPGFQTSNWNISAIRTDARNLPADSVLWAYNYQNRLVSLLGQTNFSFVTLCSKSESPITTSWMNFPNILFMIFLKVAMIGAGV